MKKSLFAIGIIGLAALLLGAQYGSMDVLGILKVNTIQKLTGGTAVYVEDVYVSGGQIGASTDRPDAYIHDLNVSGTVTGISSGGGLSAAQAKTADSVWWLNTADKLRSIKVWATSANQTQFKGKITLKKLVAQ